MSSRRILNYQSTLCNTNIPPSGNIPVSVYILFLDWGSPARPAGQQIHNLRQNRKLSRKKLRALVLSFGVIILGLYAFRFVSGTHTEYCPLSHKLSDTADCIVLQTARASTSCPSRTRAGDAAHYKYGMVSKHWGGVELAQKLQIVSSDLTPGMSIVRESLSI